MSPKFFVVAALTSLSFLASAETCNPAPQDVAKLIEVAPSMYNVKGKLAEFDPCHSSVDFDVPRTDAKPPLMIISHGGAGLGQAERNIARAFRKQGFATLIYDAYQMNGFNKDLRFWSANATNEARQRMNYKVTLGAYHWALKNEKIDTSQIYFNGVSNGAATVVNIAAVVDPKHVKGVFAEGLPTTGLGVPDELKVPVRLINGKLDNYAGRKEDDWRWLIKERCAYNGRVEDFIQAPGSALRCNWDKNENDLSESGIEWYETQKKKNANIENWWYENAAHSMFLGPLSKDMRTWGKSDTRYAWTGGDQSARDKFMGDIKTFVQSK